ncbi:MAG: hypothetical protein IJX53_06950 [Clostridia bacterium]|nr:hypothetical protein [Clostridia bacterium]
MKKKLFASLMCLSMLAAALITASADETVIAKDYYGNDITALKQIATPSAIFSYKGDSPGSLKDGTDARWTAYAYTGTDVPWVQYDFLCAVTVESCVVRWYDDGGGCRWRSSTSTPAAIMFPSPQPHPSSTSSPSRTTPTPLSR